VTDLSSPSALVDPAVAEQLDVAAGAFVESLVALDAHDPAFAGSVGAIRRMGDRELREAATVCDRMLGRLVTGNAAIEQERVALSTTLGRLRQYALLAERLDRALEERILGLQATDPDRAAVLRQEVRLHVLRRCHDLRTRLAIVARLEAALADIHAAIEAVEATDGGGVSPAGAGDLVLPASIPPVGVLPASLSGGD
jgi:Toxic anion resistance protein (TelA)